MTPILKKAKIIITRTCVKLFFIFPITNKIVFISHAGNNCSCNPKAIFDELKKQRPELKCIWLLRDASVRIDGAKVIKYPSLKAIFHLATAVLWIDNARMPLWASKRKGQFYVQTWHAGIMLKKVEKDAADRLPEYYIACAKQDSKFADIFLSGSRWQTENYRNSFWYTGRVLEFGLPRSDVFYRNSEQTKRTVFDFYNMPEETQVVLYAPTFRADKGLSAYLCENDYHELLDAVRSKFGGEWKILVRLHPNIAKKQTYIEYNSEILNGNKYDEINDLIVACDVLLTDYSSCMFDAMETGKNTFLYTADIHEYMEERGMYFLIEELPFPRAETLSELIKSISSFDEDEYHAKVRGFLERVGNFNDGHASEKAVRYILNRFIDKTTL